MRIRTLALVALLALFGVTVDAKASDFAWRRLRLAPALDAADIDIVRGRILYDEYFAEIFNPAPDPDQPSQLIFAPLSLAQDVFVGRADLDDDGKDEFVIIVSHVSICGSAGCWMVILKRDGDIWKDMCQGSGYEPDFAVTDLVQANGRRVFRSGHLQYWFGNAPEKFHTDSCVHTNAMRDLDNVRPPPSIRKPFPYPPHRR